MLEQDLHSLSTLSDDELLVRLSNALNQSRRIESVLIAHIAEVDARRLYAREASPSMFQYCVDVLHLSEAEAYFRIKAARASRRFPVLLTMLADGRLHLSAIEALAPHLDEANCDEVLARAAHKSKRQIKELVAELAPKPDVPPSVRKLPERRTVTSPAPAAPPTSRPREEPTASGRSYPQPQPATRSNHTMAARPTVEPLAPARYKVQFTASAELHDKLERLAALMPGADLAAVVETAVTEKLERLEAKRFGQAKRPRTIVDDADTSESERARNIPAPIRRFVWTRDGGRCTYISKNRKRCPERHNVQFHHDEPYARGGDHSTENIRLLCPTHNLLMAEKDYGSEAMAPYRRQPDRIGEPPPILELRPDAVRTRRRVIRTEATRDAVFQIREETLQDRRLSFSLPD